jgi:hypothetical protein
MTNSPKIAGFFARNRASRSKIKRIRPKTAQGAVASRGNKASASGSTTTGEFRDPISDDKEACTLKIMCLLSIG